MNERAAINAYHWLNVSLTGAGPETHVNSQKQLPWHLSSVVPYCTVFEGPPSLKSIFIFAVLTFSSSRQRHNEGFLQLLWPASVQYMQTKHSKREKLLFISAFSPLSRACIPHKENCHLFSQHNRGTSARDSRGLILEGKRFVTDCKERPSIWDCACRHVAVVVSFRNGPWSCCLFISGGLFISWLTRRHVPETAVTQALAVCRHPPHQWVCFESKLLFPRSGVWHSMKPSSSRVCAAQ